LIPYLKKKKENNLISSKYHLYHLVACFLSQYHYEDQVCYLSRKISK